MEQLTSVEEMIMKCIWNYGKEMPFLQLGKELKEKYDKEYKIDQNTLFLDFIDNYNSKMGQEDEHISFV